MVTASVVLDTKSLLGSFAWRNAFTTNSICPHLSIQFPVTFIDLSLFCLSIDIDSCRHANNHHLGNLYTASLVWEHPRFPTGGHGFNAGCSKYSGSAAVPCSAD